MNTTDEPRPPAGSGETGSAVAPVSALRVGPPRSPTLDPAAIWGDFWIDFMRGEFDAARENVAR